MDEYVIGKNKHHNWQLFDDADKNHFLFHLESFPSCYVIVKKSELNREDIVNASNMCKMNSKYKNLKGVFVFYTKISNLKKGNETGELIILKKSLVNRIKI
jgi:hypothetical protein